MHEEESREAHKDSASADCNMFAKQRYRRFRLDVNKLVVLLLIVGSSILNLFFFGVGEDNDMMTFPLHSEESHLNLRPCWLSGKNERKDWFSDEK